ncbi:hypothetical protein, partial [Romboutsia sp. MSSM.1001216sp_RTP31141st1_F12_RTP31141_220114]|uniref:hypothetical protein n=1 Tax=Romboutsia sp. MSSM.1001216sp_RTP31141st1_F12_RTP31141_220114 TaxID=3141594 RepID=UPI0031B60867
MYKLNSFCSLYLFFLFLLFDNITDELKIINPTYSTKDESPVCGLTISSLISSIVISNEGFFGGITGGFSGDITGGFSGDITGGFSGDITGG